MAKQNLVKQLTIIQIKYFTDEVMERLETVCNQYFKYETTENRTDDNQESDTDEQFTESNSFLKSEYFDDSSEQLLYKEITHYFDKYGDVSTLEALLINLENLTGQTRTSYQE